MAGCPVVAMSPRARPAVHEGVVYVIDKQDQGAHVKWYLKAYCIGADGQPARLVVFENPKHANKGKPVIRVIQFSDVKSISSSDINKHHKKLIVLVVCNEDDFLFYVKSEDDHAKWFGYCNVLFTMPMYVIPEIPKRNLVSRECTNKYSDPSKFGAAHIFVVYLINEGVASILGLSGLHIITIKESDRTFNVYAYHTEKHLVAWDHDKIRRSGCIESLVFIEPGRKCHGGPGLLLMYCSSPSKLRECLHNFIHAGWNSSTTFTSAESVSVDPDVSSTYLTSGDSRQLVRTDQTVPLTASQGWYMPPSTKPKGIPTSCVHTDKITPSIDNSVCSSSNSQPPSPSCEKLSAPNHDSFSNQAEFRLRSEVISKSQITTYRQSESFSKLKSKKLNCRSHVTQPSQNAGGTETQEPPPLPPKPKKFPSSASVAPPSMTDRTTSYDSSCSSLTSVYEHTNCSQSKLLPNSPHSQSSGSQASLKESVEERLLQECAVIITRKLDISTILSHLLQCGLLTRKDQQFLLNQMRTDDDKVYYLLYNLPRKADGWFDRFLECLRDSQEGTGHKDIADTLEAKLKEARHQSSLNIPTTVPIPVTSDTDEPYPVFVESQSNDTVDIVQVLPSDSVESLISKARDKFNISSTEALRVELKESPLHLEKSVGESRIHRYSYIIVHKL